MARHFDSASSVIWERELPFSQIGSHSPVFEALNDSIYISDGWGTPYSSIRLRRISLVDGSETASVVLRDMPGCLCFSPDGKSLIAALGKRLVEVSRKNLDITNQWKSEVPHYSFYGSMSARVMLLMNWRGPSLSIYDLDKSSCRKKRAGSCQGIMKLDDDAYIVCSGKEGIIWRYSFKDSSLSKLIETPPFIRARYLPQSSQLLVSLGEPYEISSDSAVHHSYSKHLRAYSLKDLSHWDYRLLTSFGLFEVSRDDTILYLSRKTKVDLYTMERGRLKKARSVTLPAGFEVLSIISERSMVVAVSHHQREWKSTLVGVSF